VSFKIQAPPLQATQAEPTAQEAKAKENAQKAGRDFEAILLRQMLTSAKVAGKGGYSDMAIESLATSITSAGGLGMGRAIEDALSAHKAHIAAPPLAAPAEPPAAPAPSRAAAAASLPGIEKK
jgi:Rod binding domain-containing protein